MFSFQFEAIGTHWQIDIFHKVTRDRELSIKKEVLSRIEEFDNTYSRFRPDSWVVKSSLKPNISKLPPDALPLLEFYRELYIASAGLVTPLIGKTLEDAGYDREYSLKPNKHITKPPTLADAIEWKEHEIKFKLPVLLDFGAAGKGYIVDIVSTLLDRAGFAFYCVDAGGDIFYKGNKELRVGLEHPDDPKKAIGIAHIKNQSICASAGNRRKWANFHHTINPFTLKSPDEIKAVWTISDNAMLADGLATALTLNTSPSTLKDFKFEYVLVYKDNTVIKSKGFKGELFNNAPDR